MAELTKKLNVKKDGAAEEIKLYSTLDEVNNQGVSLKSDGINCYAAYGDASDSKASNLNYKPSGSDVSYKLLKEAASTSSGDGVTITLKARRNNEDYMQDLPSVTLDPGKKFYLNNANAPTIEGYDFVCCSINNFIPDKDTEINVYYIPQTVPNRTKTYWGNYGKDATGDLSLTDYVNTYAATNLSDLFYHTSITGLPKINMSNVTDISSLCEANSYNGDQMPKITSVDAKGWDVGNVTTIKAVFKGCDLLISLDASTWDTTKVRSMSFFLSGCYALKTLDISSWDTSNVTDMTYMCANCNSLTTIIGGTIDMSSCTSCGNMWRNCDKLRGVHLKNVPRSLDISNIGGTEGTTYIIDNYLD